jgi:hypothetical protein
VSLEPLCGFSELGQNLLWVASVSCELDRSTPVHERSFDVAARFSEMCTVSARRGLEIVRRASLALGDEGSLRFERLVPAAENELARCALMSQPAHPRRITEALGDLQAFFEQLICPPHVERGERLHRDVVGDRPRLR